MNRAAVFVLVAAGIAFRLWATGQARFTEEEARFWETALQIVRGESFPAYGPPLTGGEAKHPGPLFYYLVAAAQLAGDSPRIGSAFVALLHGLLGFVLFDLGRRLYSERAGLAVLGLFAFAPWDVLYGDRIWLSCVAPVWGTLAIYTSVRRWEIALVALLLIGPQLHMSAPIVWVTAAALLGARPRWSRVAIGAAIAALFYLPPIAAEVSSGFENTLAILTKGGGARFVFGRLFNIPFRTAFGTVLFGSSEIGYHFARGYWRHVQEWEYLGRQGLWSILDAGTVLVSGAACYSAIRRRDPFARSLLYGLAAAAVLMLLMRKRHYPHYINVFMPVVLLPVAAAIERWRRAAVVVVFVAFAMACSTVRYYREVDSVRSIAAAEDGTHPDPIVREIFTRARGQPRDRR